MDNKTKIAEYIHMDNTMTDADKIKWLQRYVRELESELSTVRHDNQKLRALASVASDFDSQELKRLRDEYKGLLIAIDELHYRDAQTYNRRRASYAKALSEGKKGLEEKLEVKGNIPVPIAIAFSQDLMRSFHSVANKNLKELAAENNPLIKLAEMRELHYGAKGFEMATIEAYKVYGALRNPRYLALEVLNRLHNGDDDIDILQWLRLFDEDYLKDMPKKPEYPSKESRMTAIAKGLVEAVAYANSNETLQQYTSDDSHPDAKTIRKYLEWLNFLEKMADGYEFPIK